MRWAVLGALIVPASIASAHQPPPEYDVETTTALVEVAPWLGLGGGGYDLGGRNDGHFDLRVDVGATFRFSDQLRAGLWVDARSANFATFEPVVGVRFAWSPERVHWFHADGRWTIAVDVGAGYAWRDVSRFDLGDGAVAVGRLWFGFTAPLLLLDAYPRDCGSRHAEEPGQRCTPPAGVVSGARLYAEVRRGLDPVPEWEATFGLEFEVIGSFWFLGGG